MVQLHWNFVCSLFSKYNIKLWQLICPFQNSTKLILPVPSINLQTPKKMLLLGFTTLLNILGHQRRFRHRA